MTDYEEHWKSYWKTPELEELWKSYKKSDVVYKVEDHGIHLGKKIRRLRFYRDGKMIFRGWKRGGKWHYQAAHFTGTGKSILQYFDNGYLINKEAYLTDDIITGFLNWRNLVVRLKKECF